MKTTFATSKDAAKAAAVAHANLNTWGAVVALLEAGLLTGPSAHYYGATSKVIRIAKAQMQNELKRYDRAFSRVRADRVTP